MEDADALRAEIDRLRHENDALRAQPVQRLQLKVSGKGCLSVYGLGRFPVSLYREQWERLLDAKEDIQAFMAENAASLKTIV